MTLLPVAGSQQGQLLMPSRYALQTQIAQGWPKSWANLRPLVGILSQNAGQVAQFGPSRC